MDALFSFLNLLPMPVWLSMMLFPRARFTQRMVLSPWPVVAVSAVYVVLLLASIGQGIQSGDPLAFDMAGLQAGFASDLGFLVGWAHYLALDLFAGIWIFRDAKYWGKTPTLFLLFTLLAGPLGLGAYLVWRRRWERDDPVRTLN